jgi:phosphoglycolate phosphatase-like HAD superfamily hydrolase
VQRVITWTAGQVVVIDVDGTLVDTNYHHVLAWQQAFDEIGVFVPTSALHRHVGMGGDQFVPAVAGDDVERDRGDDVRERHDAIYRERFIDEVRPYPDARRALERFRALGLKVVLASSAKEDEIDRYLDLLDARELCDAWTSSSDVERTKPHPDLLEVAIDEVDAEPAFLLGDSVWDCEAARTIDLPTIAVLTGGFGEDELRRAGAVEVLADLGEVLERIDALGAREGDAA